jgi:hypothetical protein
LFSSQNINDTITTSWFSAIGSARGIGGIAVSSSLIAFFTGLEDAITTLRIASGVAIVARSVQRSIITVLIIISDTVTAEWEGTVSTALVGVDSEIS